MSDTISATTKTMFDSYLLSFVCRGLIFCFGYLYLFAYIKRTKGQTTIYKTLHRKIKIEQHEIPQKSGDELSAPEGLTVAVLHVTPFGMIKTL
jgi:hypothetical protein